MAAATEDAKPMAATEDVKPALPSNSEVKPDTGVQILEKPGQKFQVRFCCIGLRAVCCVCGDFVFFVTPI